MKYAAAGESTSTFTSADLSQGTRQLILEVSLDNAPYILGVFPIVMHLEEIKKIFLSNTAVH